MKHFIKYSLYLIALMVISLSVNAQNRTVDRCNYGLQIGPLGLYGYNERELADQVALRIELGMAFGLENITNPERAQLYLLHHIALEPRYYYNIKSRAKSRKNTYGNSAEFVTMKMRLRPGYIFSPTLNISAIPTLGFMPSWGFRRVFKEKLAVELGGGIGYQFFLNDKIHQIYEKDEINHLVLNLHCRFGIHFGKSKD